MGESEEVLKLESPSTDSQLLGSLLNRWTDEKHIIFLNGIESSFVNELYNEKYDLSAYQRWLSRMKMRKGSCGQCESDRKSDQLKVLRMGCWENFLILSSGKDWLNFLSWNNLCIDGEINEEEEKRVSAQFIRCPFQSIMKKNCLD